MKVKSDYIDEKEKTEKTSENEKVEREAGDRVEAEEDLKLPLLDANGPD